MLAILPTLEIFIQRPPTLRSLSLLPNGCDQRLLVAFPTLLLFQKVPSPASDCPSSSWVQACSQTFCLMILVSSSCSSQNCDESYLLEYVGPGTNSFLSLVAFLAQEGAEDHVQPLASRALPTPGFYV